MLQNLCGTGIDALKKVVLVTTMWDEVDEEEGNNRENELTTIYWKRMIELGCHTSRFYNDTESALDIVSQFQNARCTVLLERELVDLYLESAETSAASDRRLCSFLAEFIKKIKELKALIETKLKNRYTANQITVREEKAKTMMILRMANVQRRRYSVSSSVYKRISSSRFQVSSTPLGKSYLSIEVADDSNKSSTTSGFPGTTQTSSPTGIGFPPPPLSLADATGQTRSRTHTALQGTITALKLIQQLVGLAPIPGLQSLVGVVLNISEVVNVSFGATYMACKILTLSIQRICMPSKMLSLS